MTSRPSSAQGTNSVFNSRPPTPTAKLLVDEVPNKKWKNMWIRTLWTIVMVTGFIGIILAGHIWVILLVILIQTLVYKEVISIAHVPSKEKKLPWFRALNWYFLVSTNYFLYGESIIFYFKQSVYVDAFLLPLATHHRFISFILYVAGFVLFVMNLKKGHYKFQFAQFGWTHMTLLLVVCQSHFIINNIFEGMIWFVLPISLVIVNDIMAYICGFFWGRTPLIKLSPKKTWEGFIGALIFTMVFGFFFSKFLAQSSYMICPAKNLSTSYFDSIHCDINPVFIPVQRNLPPALVALIKHIFRVQIQSVTVAPLQIHALVMTCFASLIAPFGGFFASGLKRAFKIKDFGESIPGHGGVTDRFDCQFIMGLFSYMYVQSFVKVYGVTVGGILQTAITYLNAQDQIELYKGLQEYLTAQRLI